MADTSNDYAVHYRWEWFRRSQWRGTFRQRKRHSSGGFVELVTERGLADEPVLDCSCGLGLKTIVMHEAGLNVRGADGCAAAVEYARLLAAEEGRPDIAYFRSAWADLPGASDERYAAIFNDALSWVYTEEEMAASLRGFHEALQPGGLLVYMGAVPGSDGSERTIMEQEWRRLTADGTCGLGWRHAEGGVSVQELWTYARGGDFIDKRHLLVIDEDGARRLEDWTLRHAYKWQWPKMESFLRAAGFVEFTTKEFMAANRKAFPLTVVRRG